MLKMSDGEFQIPESVFDEIREDILRNRVRIQELKTKPMTGVERIAQERLEQKIKHHRSVKSDVEHNDSEQLRIAAMKLCHYHRASFEPPEGWDKELWMKMINKTNEERLVIAGALIAAEIDRLNFKQ